jgi:tetratricopeptide (TPR) repeat protein
LALHIDTDFLVGAICADENDQTYPIKNSNDDFLWLYFYNDPYTNVVSFGKDNKKHYSEGKTNYYGNFIQLIEDENNIFSIGEYEYPIIELLRYSKLIEKLKTDFSKKTLENSDKIPTLLTFSLSINELAKQKLVDYLKTQDFNIVSYTIPLAELACRFALKNNKKKFADGNIVSFLEATNTDLHLLKLIFSTDYFLLDGKPETKQGLGIDPRKRALLKFVVNKIGTMGVLSEQEKEIEYKIMEPKTEEWLTRLDMLSNNGPIDVNESLSKTPTKRRVLIYKDKIAEFTGSDTKLILDTYNGFINRNFSQEVSAIFLIGNCFQNDIIQTKFQNLIAQDNLYIYSNKDIQNILSVYPKIDFQRYISEEERIKVKAIAEENKRVEQRELEYNQRKEQEAEEKRVIEEKEKEKNRREAQKFYYQAVEFEKKEQLQDAIANVEKALQLDPDNNECQNFLKILRDKSSELKIKTEQYKSLLNKARELEKNKDLERALNIYELAQEIFDYAEIQNKIFEVKEKIRKKEEQKEEINQLLKKTELLIDQSKLEDAKKTIKQVLEIDATHREAKTKLENINVRLQEIEIQYNTLVTAADKNFNSGDINTAESIYKEALKIKQNDKYCLGQIAMIEKKKKTLPPPPPPPPPSSTKPMSKTNNNNRATVIIPPPPPPLPLTNSKPVASNTNSAGASMPPPSPPNVPKKSSGKMGAPPPPPPPPPPNKKK